MNDSERRGADVRALTLGDRLFVALQHVLPQHTLSRIVHRLTRTHARGVKNGLISAFVRGFRPRMDEAREPDPFAYRSFNEFFTRELKGGARRVDHDARAVVSPVDGSVSQIGSLEAHRLLQAKNRYYALADLLGGNEEWTRRFAGGSFATLYLAPYDYHRIHMPLAGRLAAAWFVPGRLFSVNATTAASVAGLFARNERVVCCFEGERGPFAIVLVGALFVGSMTTVWHGEVTPRRPRRPTLLSVGGGATALSLPKGAEMGRFNMGSTVIVLFPPRALEWRAGLAAGSIVRMGEPIGSLHD